MKKYCIFALLCIVLASCQESLEDRCERDAREYTRKNCPAAIDETTIVDSLTFDRATHTIHYYYRLTGVADPPALRPIKTTSTDLPILIAQAKTRRRSYLK